MISKRGLMLFRIFILVAFVAVCFSGIGSAASANDSSKNVYQCGTLDSPGVYTMNQSIIPSGAIASCINVTNQNITLDCNWSWIRNTTLNAAGIYSNQINTTIKNCNISIRYSANGKGIFLKNSNFSTIINSIIDNSAYGIYLETSANNIISNITINSNQYGIYATDSTNNIISNITLTKNIRGIYLEVSSDNNFSQLTSNSNRYGITISGESLNNLIANSSSTYDVFPYTMDSGLSNVFTGNVLRHNLNPRIISSTSTLLMLESFPRNYSLGDRINFNITVIEINGSKANNFIYNISISPNEDLSITNINLTSSNKLAINFTPTKSGIYSLKVNITTLPLNNSEIRNFIFIIGNTSSKTDRYYMHADEPNHGQPLAFSGYDSGAMFPYPTTTEEERHCALWIQTQPDKIVNQYFMIKNVSVGWFYNGSGTILSRLQKYSTYDETGDYSQTVPASATYVFNTTTFTNLNITLDYAWKFYWLTLKLYATNYPSVISNATQQSYADFTYLYAGPKIEYFGENFGSDIRNMNLLSNVFNDNTNKNVTLQFEGNGNFTIVLNLTSTSYTINYDGISCSSNQNCTVNSNSNGIINLTLSLGSLHTLDIFETIAPSIPLTATPVSSGGGGNIVILNQNQIKEGITQSVYLGGVAVFSVNNERHNFVVTKLGNNSAEIILSSTPQKLIFNVGEEKKVNLNNDSYYDIYLKLDAIDWYKANFVIKEIHELISEVMPPVNENKTGQQGTNILPLPENKADKENLFERGEFWLVLVLVTILFLFLKRPKKDNAKS